MRKIGGFILLALMLCGCVKEMQPGTSGYGALELRLDSGSAVRLETKSFSDELLDGLRFQNVLVILTDNSGNVVGNVYKTYPYVPGVDDIQDAEGSDPVTKDVIHFEHLLPGNYNVYAYANIDATTWQSSELISAQEKTATSGSFTSYLDRELAGLTTAGTDTPDSPATSMLLTGKKTIPVGLSVANDTLELSRPVVRFSVTVRNHTSFPVTVDGLSFSHFNPDKAYLIDHSSSGVPVAPDGVTYRALPPYPILSGSPSTVAAESEAVVYQTLLYENASPNAYKIFSTLTLDRSEGMSDLTISMGERPFGVIDYTTLSQMDEGESIDVLVMNPQKNPRSGRLFYGIGTGYLAWESVGYATYEPLVARANAIFVAKNSSFAYSGYTYNNTNGYSSWDGSSDPSTATSFNYSGARSTHFRTITKTDGLYSIEGLAINPATETSITNLSVEQGAINDAGKFPSDLPGDNLVRFKQSNGNYLQSDCNWGKTGDQAKYSYIKSVSGGTNQDRQFILFGKYQAGGKLKRILSENNKEVPLTYMSRNEDVNVVINVYYADQEGSIDFVVDNSTWTNAAATTSSHTFN